MLIIFLYNTTNIQENTMQKKRQYNIIHKIIIITQYDNIIRQGGKVRKIQYKTRQGNII
jgi:hypothetical protein